MLLVIDQFREIFYVQLWLEKKSSSDFDGLKCIWLIHARANDRNIIRLCLLKISSV